MGTSKNNERATNNMYQHLRTAIINTIDHDDDIDMSLLAVPFEQWPTTKRSHASVSQNVPIGSFSNTKHVSLSKRSHANVSENVNTLTFGKRNPSLAKRIKQAEAAGKSVVAEHRDGTLIYGQPNQSLTIDLNGDDANPWLADNKEATRQ